VSNPVEVLVLDDEAIVCERLRDYLEKKGMSVETFTESPKALDRLTEKSFDVVITDMRMEGATGMDVLLAAKRDSPGPEVIIITAYARFETLRDAEAARAFRYIAKPFKMSEMYTLVKKAARKSRRKST
jgi:DNA-binding NtrC family response regulator